MKFIQHFIKGNDFLGPEIKFTINKEENFKTVVGGFFSLIAYFFYLFFFIIFGLDMFLRQKPLIQMETMTDEQPPFSIDTDTFLAFRIEDIKGNLFTNISDIFSIYISYELYDNINQKSIEKIFFNYESCNSQKYLKFFDQNTIKIFPPQEWFCFNTSKVIGKNLSGTVDTDTYSFLSLQLDVCHFDKNYTAKNQCNEITKIRDFFSKNNLNLALLFNQINFSPADYKRPLKTNMMKYANTINRNIFRKDYISFVNHLVTQDDSIIFPDEHDLINLYWIEKTKIEKFFTIKSNDELQAIYSSRGDPEINNLFNAIFLFDKE